MPSAARTVPLKPGPNPRRLGGVAGPGADRYLRTVFRSSPVSLAISDRPTARTPTAHGSATVPTNDADPRRPSTALRSSGRSGRAGCFSVRWLRRSDDA